MEKLKKDYLELQKIEKCIRETMKTVGCTYKKCKQVISKHIPRYKHLKTKMRNITFININNRMIIVYKDKSNDPHEETLKGSIKNSIFSLADEEKYPRVLNKSLLDKDEITHLNTDIHPFFEISEYESLLLVENAIHTIAKNKETFNTLYKNLSDAINGSKIKCTERKYGDMINVLSGFTDDVKILMSDNYHMGYIISLMRNKGEEKEKVIEELISRGYKLKDIHEWMEYY